MPLPPNTKGRFALLTTGRFVVGAAALYRAVEIYEADGPSALSFAFLTVGLVLLWWGVVGIRALLRGNAATDEALIASSVADVDRHAPSGLKPLWIGLAVILGAFVIWVLIAGLAGAT